MTEYLARWTMERASTRPLAPPAHIGDLQEVFDHPYYVHGDEATRQAVRSSSCSSKFAGENAYPWDNYFEVPLDPYLRERDVLDLGCFNGGRTVAWHTRYSFRSFAGVDVRPEYIEAATAFAASNDLTGIFRVGFGESLPFADRSFDAIVSFDVLEHVRSVEATLNECWRVLRRGGVLIAAFPGYFQPNEHHLGLATRVPGLQLLFSGKTLVRAYSEILSRRGQEAEWYRRQSPELAGWERGHTLNGITYRRFQQLLSSGRWRRLSVSRKTIGTVGRNIQAHGVVRGVSKLLRPLAYVPGVQEVFLHRVAVILERRDSGGGK